VRYRVVIKPSARRQILKLDRAVQKRIVSALEGLAENPYPPGSRKLQGMDDAHRIRVGDYRIVYVVQKKRLVVLVVRVAHRKDVYRKGG